tara:strand:+ start:1089 stop:1703 length:615 start_codon:yes stop_codon:yes gene_type:complete
MLKDINEAKENNIPPKKTVLKEIRDFLVDNEGESFTSKQISKSIKRSDNTVRKYISPLADLDEITRIGKKRKRGVRYSFKPEYYRKLVKVEIYCGSSSENAESLTYEPTQEPNRERELVKELLDQLQRNGKGNCIIRKDQSGHLIKNGMYATRKGKRVPLYGVLISELTPFTDFETIDFGYDNSLTVESQDADYIYPDIKTVIN